MVCASNQCPDGYLIAARIQGDAGNSNAHQSRVFGAACGQQAAAANHIQAQVPCDATEAMTLAGLAHAGLNQVSNIAALLFTGSLDMMLPVMFAVFIPTSALSPGVCRLAHCPGCHLGPVRWCGPAA